MKNYKDCSRSNLLLIFLVLGLLGCQEGGEEGAGNEELTLSYELVSDDFVNPWGMAFLPNGDILVTEKSGVIKRISNGEVVDRDVNGGPITRDFGQGGLLDIELHPQFSTNGWVYFTSASFDGDAAMTALTRAKWNGTGFEDREELYKGSPSTEGSVHFGSRIAFDNDGYVYFSIGDRGDRDNLPQDLTKDGGKIYRLHDDGRVPDDNPFVDVDGAISAVYSYGHRNPQGMAKRPSNGQIWSHEHGPLGGDEVNIINSGSNYGWPEVTFGMNYNGTLITSETSRPGMADPVIHWSPSIAPCGMAFVENGIYEGWNGNLIVGSLKFNYLVRCTIDGDEIVEQEIIANGIGRVRNVEMGNDGHLYVGVEGQGIFRLIME